MQLPVPLDYSRLEKVSPTQPEVSVMLLVKRPYQHTNLLRLSFKWNPSAYRYKELWVGGTEGALQWVKSFFTFHSSSWTEFVLCHVSSAEFMVFACRCHSCLLSLALIYVAYRRGLLVNTGCCHCRCSPPCRDGGGKWEEGKSVGEDRWRTGSVSALTPLSLHFSADSCGQSRFLCLSVVI